MAESTFTREEMMTVAAARQLADGAVCFVGIGLPSAAANLARRCRCDATDLGFRTRFRLYDGVGLFSRCERGRPP